MIRYHSTEYMWATVLRCFFLTIWNISLLVVPRSAWTVTKTWNRLKEDDTEGLLKNNNNHYPYQVYTMSTNLSEQKKLVGIISGERGRYHADPLFAKLQILKVDDLYRQQLRVHAWKFWNGKLPSCQAQALRKVSEVHTHNTRAAQREMSIKTQDHKSIAYRVPKEWETLGEELKSLKSLAGFKKTSRRSFIAKYRNFQCETRGCYVCNLD